VSTFATLPVGSGGDARSTRAITFDLQSPPVSRRLRG